MDWIVLGQQIWYGLVKGAGYVLFASGLTLAFGIMGILNMAHGELCMLGALLVYSVMTALGVNYFLAGAVSIVSVAAFGVILNRIAVQPLLNYSRLSVLLSTVALSFIILNGGLALWGTVPKRVITPFAEVRQVGGVHVSDQSIMLFVLGAIAIAALHIWLKRARLGKSMRATAQNDMGANLTGINIKRVYDYTLVLAAGLAALAGVLLAPIVTAYPTMGQPMLLMGFVVVIVGGLGNIPGVIVVGLLIGVIEALFGQYVSTFFSEAFVYGIMVLVLLLKPQGLFVRR